MSLMKDSAEDLSPELTSTLKPLNALTVEELRAELRDSNQSTAGNKAALVDRLKKVRDGPPEEHQESAHTKGADDKPSELMLLFHMMQQQTKLQLEEIRLQAKEERYQLAQFMADLRQKAETKSPSDSEEENLPHILERKFKRMNNEFLDVLQALDLKQSTSTSVEEIDVYIKAAETGLSDLKTFLDSKVDLLEEGNLKSQILQGFQKSKQIYLDHMPSAKSKLSKLRSEEEEDKVAGSLPIGVNPPSFHGDILKFPSFWESFEPLVHSNPKVSKFYKITYLKAAMKGAASGVLNGFPSTADNYIPAVEAVLRRYGREQAIVRSHVKDLLNGERVERDTEQVRGLLDRANAKKAILSQHNVVWDQIFTQILEAQLPTSLYERWIRKISPLIEADKVADSKLLIDFISIELATMESLQRNAKTTDDKADKKSKLAAGKTQVKSCPEEPVYTAQSLVAQADSSASCLHCGMSHTLKSCRYFLKLPPQQRMAELIAKPGKVCFRCLAPRGEKGHPNNFYQCKERCPIEDCGKPHHQLLHIRPDEAKTMVSRSADKPIARRGNFHIDTLLPTALARITHAGKTRTVRVAFDSLSQKSFITREVVDYLNIPSRSTEYLTVSGFGGTSSSKRMSIVEFVLSSLSSDSTIKIEAHVQDGIICTPLDDICLFPEQITHLRGLALADPIPRKGGKVDILLGGRYYFSLMQGSVIYPETPDSAPSAIDTLFGWVIAGPFLKSKIDTSSSCLLIRTPHKDSEDRWRLLNSRLERFWELDSIGLVDTRPAHTSDEISAIQKFENSIKFEGERYCVSLPFRDTAPDLKPNYQEAFIRLLAAERTLKKKPSKLADYDKAIMQYVENGFAKKLTMAEIDDIQKRPHYFVPHHPVLKESSTSTKIRIVFDASSKNSQGQSLNDCLLKGPNLLPDILSVLLRFRLHKIVLSGDIRKMFCQTEISADHGRYQLYLWRHCDSERPPDIYMMSRLMFGVSASPFLAIQAIRHHARIQRENGGCTSTMQDIINENMYVDDVYIGGDSVREVTDLQRSLVKLLSSGGWSLVKFASNSAEVMDQIPEDAKLATCVLDLDSDGRGEASSLGLKWHTTEDVLYCNVKPRLLQQDKVVTKKSMLSKISQIYDIFGFFAAFVIRGKILLQDVWRQKLDWNDPVDENTASKYRKWTEELILLESIKIPRCVIFRACDESRNIQLHGFADASEAAYGAVLYVRIEDSEGTVQIRYLLSKTRVSPLKAISVARLELMAAHCLSQLVAYVGKAWKNVRSIDNTYLWLDSEIALAWIARPSSHWKTFVRNRVQEIHDSVSSNAWRHCPGPDNPADLHSRGTSLSELKTNDRYWLGPHWLSLKESNWPNNKVSIPDSIDVAEMIKETARANVVATVVAPALEIPFFGDRYNDYNKIVRVTARILRWKTPSSVYLDPGCDNLLIGPNEYKYIENHLFRLVQRSAFGQDYDDLQSGKVPSHKCKFRSMDPQFDPKRQLIVAGNRLDLSDLPDESKHPVILPAHSSLVDKLIMYVHVTNFHAPQDTTIAILRQTVHVIHIRGEVRRVLRSCIVCKHGRTKPLAQKMGVLPEERICEGPAFSDVGLDFTGPVYLKTETERMQKAYICLFTCPRSRLVHLELTNNMSSEEFLAALRRMMNRRGWVNKVICDNQKTFKKAEKIMALSIHASFKGRSNEALQKFLTDNAISWSYITERSPHRGGFYERMNRSLKEPLRKVLGKAKLNYSELYTVLTDIECVMNQRPLTYLGADPRNPEAITPSHLAIGRSLKQQPYLPSGANVTKRYRYLQILQKQFWSRWRKDYLPSLLRRGKWTTEHNVPQIGDICLIADDGRSRPSWNTGRVVEAILGKDGLVRTFKLKTAKGLLTRPIQKLHLLERNDLTHSGT